MYKKFDPRSILAYDFYSYKTIVWMIKKININTNPFEI